MRSPRFRHSLGAGFVIGLASLLSATLLFAAFWVISTVFQTQAGPADVMGRLNVRVIAAFGLGAFVTGGLGWWLLAADRPSRMRGLVVGIAAGMASHPAGWFVVLLIDGSGWKDLLILPLLTGAFSLVIVGWLTVPLPALAGAALGSWLARKEPGAQGGLSQR